MNIPIKNQFLPKNIEYIATYIYERLASESYLSKRSYPKIIKMLKNNEVYVSMSGIDVIAFIFSEKLTKDYMEMAAWYMEPKYRGRGVALKLFNKIHKDKTRSYIFFTFSDRIIEFAQKRGFEAITLTQLPLVVRVKLLIKRISFTRLKEVYRQRSNSRWTLMMKTRQ